MNQPCFLRKFTVFDIGKNNKYFDDKNEIIIKDLSKRFYAPLNRLMLKLIENDINFKTSYSISGFALEQLEKHSRETLDTFKELLSTGQVELLSQTYSDSLAYFYSKKEFKEQIKLTENKLLELFGFKPKVFTTNLNITKELVRIVDSLGYKAILGKNNRYNQNFIYKLKDSDVKILLKNNSISDNINIKFSDHTWKEWPITIEKCTEWINQAGNNSNCVNIFLNSESLSQNHTKILAFLGAMSKKVTESPANDFKTPSEIVKIYKPKEYLKLANDLGLEFISLNQMQKESLKRLYALEKLIEKNQSIETALAWRKLQSSKNIHFMTTKIKSNNPYETPYNAFIAFMNVLSDLEQRLDKTVKQTIKKPKKKAVIKVRYQNEKINKEQIRSIKPESAAQIIEKLKEVYKVG